MHNVQKENKMKKQKKVLNIPDDFFEASAKSQSLLTRLIEVCDWDEDKAHDLIDNATSVIEDMYEYSILDNTKITDKKSFSTVFKAMMGDISDEQATAILDLVDDFVRKQVELAHLRDTKQKN
jgi:hypothetical protein